MCAGVCLCGCVCVCMCACVLVLERDVFLPMTHLIVLGRAWAYLRTLTIGALLRLVYPLV